MGTCIYIAGPMRSIPLYNFPAFDAAKELLESSKWEVVSPADIDRDHGFDPIDLPDDHNWNTIPEGVTLEECYDRDLSAVKEADALYLLAGWENSKGARAEKACAEWLGKEILYQKLPLEPIKHCKSPFPTNSSERLTYPIFSGVLMYWPDAMAALSKHSHRSFTKHNPGGELGWVVSESIGSMDQLCRHAMEAQIAYNAGDYARACDEAAAVHWRGAELHQRMIKGMTPFERE